MPFRVQHVNAQGTGDTVNGAVAQGKFTFLSGETCPTSGRYFGAALCVVTCREFGQESAEAILGEGRHHAGAMETGNELDE